MGSFRAFAQWEPITTFGGERAVDRFGAEIEPIGDVDDDGIPDYAVTAPGFDGAAGPESGKVYVVSGATGAWIHEIEGEQAFGLFGTAVVAVTDVNADGVPDLLISAPNFGNQPEDFHRGRAYVYSGADGSRMAVMDGEAPNDAFGTALVFIPGPTPLSGYAVVGAPAYDCRDGDGVVAQANCGRVYAFAASGLRTGAPSVWRARGQEADAAFGSSLTRAGLVDLDAVQDFAVGSPGFGGGLGRVTILSAAGGGRIRSFDGEQAGSGFGTVLAGGEDLTGDGFPDLFVGAPSFDVEDHKGPGEVPATLTDVGKVYVYDAVGGGLLATDGGRVRELSLLGQSSHFAGALRITRDLTGDGVADVLVGADGAAAFLGEVYVYAGASLGQPIHVVQEFIGPRAGQTGFGRSFADVGDLNGDGAVDLVIGADGYLNVGRANSGVVLVYSGSDAGRTSFERPAMGGTAYFGHAVRFLGDADGDGGDDFCVGAPLDPPALAYGTVECRSGVSGESLYAAKLEAPYYEIDFMSASVIAKQKSQVFGTAIARVGDLNNDGAPELLVGAPGRDRWDSLGFDDRGRLQTKRIAVAGAAFLFSGADGSPIALPGWPPCDEPNHNQDLCSFTPEGSNGLLTAIRGSVAQQKWGSVVAAAGLVDGDSIEDFVIGSFDVDTAFGTTVGMVRIYSGATGAVLRELVGEKAGDAFGISVSRAGDVDHDGREDLIVGASGFDGPAGPSSGRAYVFSGATGARIYALDGETRDAFSGYSVSDFDDVDGDGFADFLVGAYGTDVLVGGVGIADAGSVTLYSGLSGAPILTLKGEVRKGAFGESVGKGDLSGDGRPEIVVASPQWLNAFGLAVGKVYVYGAGNGPEAPERGLLLASFQGQTAGEKFGGGVGLGNVHADGLAAGGDLEGDGVPDLLVGSYLYLNNKNALEANEGRVSVFQVACRDRDGDGYGNPGTALCPQAARDCDDTSPSRNPGAFERCNGRDDDCDGEIDEGFDQLGSSCSNGFGACQGIGELVCDAAVEELACNAVRKGPEGVEIALSGLDEDCNPGTPDEAASQLEVVFVLQRIIRDLIPSLTPDVGYPTALLGGLTQP